uniref:Uncharacterized protein n=1 Tax=Opuntia streptacantha TaxID=393608 RepID=A0A7C9AFK5_OPUST
MHKNMLPQETKSERNIREVTLIESLFLVVVLIEFLQDNLYFFFKVIGHPKPFYCIDEDESAFWVLSYSQKLFPHFFFELIKFKISYIFIKKVMKIGEENSPS